MKKEFIDSELKIVLLAKNKRRLLPVLVNLAVYIFEFLAALLAFGLPIAWLYVANALLN